MPDFLLKSAVATRSLGLALPVDDGTWMRYFLPGASAKLDVDQARSGVAGQLVNGAAYNTRSPWFVQGLNDQAHGGTAMVGGYDPQIPLAQTPKPPATLMLVAKGAGVGLGDWYNSSTAMSTIAMQVIGGTLYAQSSTDAQNGAALALPAGAAGAWGIYLAVFDWQAGGNATQTLYYSDLAGNILTATHVEPAVAQTGAVNYPIRTDRLFNNAVPPWAFALAAVRSRAITDAEARAHILAARRYFAGRLV